MADEKQAKTDNTQSLAQPENAPRCIKCGVRIEDDRAHCPVCGKCVNEENIGKQRVFAYYPRYDKWKKDRRFATLSALVILLLVNVAWFGLEFGISKRLDIYWFFLAGSITFFLVGLWPFLKRTNYLTKSAVGVTAISGLLIFIDAQVVWNVSPASGLEFGWSICVVVPMFLMGYALATGATMMLRGYYGRSALYPNLYVAAVASLIFGLNITMFKPYNVVWCSIVILAVSWGVVLFLLVIRGRKIFAGIKKDLHI